MNRYGIHDIERKPIHFKTSSLCSFSESEFFFSFHQLCRKLICTWDIFLRYTLNDQNIKQYKNFEKQVKSKSLNEELFVTGAKYYVEI